MVRKKRWGSCPLRGNPTARCSVERKTPRATRIASSAGANHRFSCCATQPRRANPDRSPDQSTARNPCGTTARPPTPISVKVWYYLRTEDDFRMPQLRFDASAPRFEERMGKRNSLRPMRCGSTLLTTLPTHHFVRVFPHHGIRTCPFVERIRRINHDCCSVVCRVYLACRSHFLY